MSSRFLSENNQSVDLILSIGAFDVEKIERTINTTAEPNTQTALWREILEVKAVKLDKYRWNLHSASIARGSFKTECVINVLHSILISSKIPASFLVDLLERCSDVHFKISSVLEISTRESPFKLIHIDYLKPYAAPKALFVSAIPSWHTNLQTIEDLIDIITLRLFYSLRAILNYIKNWGAPHK